PWNCAGGSSIGLQERRLAAPWCKFLLRGKKCSLLPPTEPLTSQVASGGQVREVKGSVDGKKCSLLPPTEPLTSLTCPPEATCLLLESRGSLMTWNFSGRQA